MPMLYDLPTEPPDRRDPDEDEDEFWDRADREYEEYRDRD